MRIAHDKQTHPGKADISFLPMIDKQPTDNDMSCIFTTLEFISNECRRQMITPVVTFDQPLWMKAMKIIESEGDDSPLSKIVLLLGNCHAQMSFLGTIGYLMANSGLNEAFETCYAENSVVHMLRGKAYSRAVRAHGLLSTVLKKQLYTLPLDHETISEATNTIFNGKFKKCGGGAH